MVEFMQQYGTEAKAYRALYKARWPQGFRCPAYGDRRRSRFRRGRQVYYQCRACRHQTTLLSDTLPWGLPLVVLVAVSRRTASSQVRSGSLVASKTTNGSPQGTVMETAGGLPLQPPFSPAREAAATGAGHDAVQATLRADSAHGIQFSWLRNSPHQVGCSGAVLQSRTV